MVHLSTSLRRYLRRFLLIAVVASFVLEAQPAYAQGQCLPSPSQLVAWWPGDGTAIGLASFDSGIPVGNATFAPGLVGQAFQFGGTGYVRVADAPRLDITGDLTVDAWINPTLIAGDQRLIIDKRDPDNVNVTYALLVHTDASVWFVYRRAADGGAFGVVRTPANVVPLNTFTHVAATVQGTAVTVYVNGAAHATGTANPRVATQGPVTIGAIELAGLTTAHFVGLIDEIGLFNRALSAQEVQAIATAGAAGKCKAACIAPPASLAGWWPGDGLAADLVTETLETVVPNTTFPAGLVEQAFQFDGTGYVRGTDQAQLDLTGDLTLNAWINPNQIAGDQRLIIDKRDPDNANVTYALLVHTDASVWFVYRRAADGGAFGVIQTPPNVVPLNTFTHVAATVQGTAVTIYVNGTALATGIADPRVATQGPVTIGAIELATFTTAHFMGLIDEVGVFNRALSAREIQAIAGVGSFGQCSDLVVQDGVPPSSAISLAPSPGPSGWLRVPQVSAMITAIDQGSGVASITYSAAGATVIPPTQENDGSASLAVSGEGQTTISFQATDRSNNIETTKTSVVKLDRTPPSLSCDAGDGAWHRVDVTLSCSATDGLSGLVGAGTFQLSTSVPLGTETANAATSSQNVCDVAGNCVTAGPIAGQKIDKKIPAVTISSPQNGATYQKNVGVTALYTCSDGGSGVAFCEGKMSAVTPVPNGGPVDTTTEGTKTFQVQAGDVAGNLATSQVTYTVQAGGGGDNVTANLSIVLTAPNKVSQNSTFTYRADVANSRDTAQSVEVKIGVPAGTYFISATPSQGLVTLSPPAGTSGPEVVKAVFGDLVKNQTARLDLVVGVLATTPGGTILENRASVKSATADSDPNNNDSPPLLPTERPPLKTTVEKK